MDSAKKEHPSIPKFSSFQPKKPAAQSTPEDVKPSKERDEDGHSRHKSSHSRQHRSGDSRKRRKSKEREDRGTLVVVSSHDASSALLLNNDDEKLFKSDRKGDAANLTYGTLHRYSVPKYFRLGRGSVLGLKPRWKIDRAASDEKSIVVNSLRLEDGPKRSRLFKKGQAASRVARVIIPAADANNNPELLGDFVAVTINRKRKRGAESPEPSAVDVDYRSIEGKAKALDASDDVDLEYESGIDAADEAQEQMDALVKLRNLELTRLCKAEPRNPQAWIDLINHQDAMIQLGRSHGSEDFTESEKRSLAEVKISIYEEAIVALKHSESTQETLWLGLLEQGEKAWEVKKLAAKWHQAVTSNPNSVKIGLQHINFLQTNIAKFRYEECKLNFIKCLGLLNALIKNSNSNNLDSLCRQMVYLLLRLSVFMRQCGYHEHSIAMWQALLEFALLNSQSTDAPESINTFEEFWDSEVPRLGEPGYRGWNHYRDSPDQDAPDAFSMEEVELSPSGKLFAEFGVAERMVTEKLYFPGRTADETGEDDPYHVILFSSDIQPFLLSGFSHDSSKPYLTIAFLLYLGLPPLESLPHSDCLSWWVDPFLRTKTVDVWQNPQAKPEIQTSTSILLQGSFKHAQMTTDVLFSDAFEEGLLLDKQWTLRSLQTLVESTTHNENLAEYLVAFTFRYFPDLAVKSAKRLLKTRNSCLRLYNAYAIIESRLERIDVADKVFSTAINMSGSLSVDARKTSILLWRTWIWEHLHAGRLSESIQLLLSIGDAQSAPLGKKELVEPLNLPPSLILKTRKYLLEGRDHAISNLESTHAVLYAELLALLSYFQDGLSLDNAMDIFSSTSVALKVRERAVSAAQEILHQARAQLLNFHTSRVKLFKPSTVRKLLFESLSLFPDNTIFLTAHEASVRLDDRIRSILSNGALRETPNSVISWLFAAWASMQRSPELGGTANLTKAIFEQAVLSKSGKHSVAIWTLYFYFERNRRNDAITKDVFFRGVSNLPWAKDFVMLGFTTLADTLTFEQLQSLYAVFEEKELRVHINITEQIEDWKQALTKGMTRGL